MTEEVYQRAMRTAEDGQGLLLLANRFAQLEPLLADGWPTDFTYADVVKELYGIANGDAPRLLKGEGKQGKSLNAHALLEKKLEAHLWYKVLGKLGMKAPDRQAVLIDSYGITFDAYNKWRKEAKDKLGRDFVDRYLVTAVNSKLMAAHMEADPLGWSVFEMDAAGAAYKRELNLARG